MYSVRSLIHQRSEALDGQAVANIEFFPCHFFNYFASNCPNRGHTRPARQQEKPKDNVGNWLLEDNIGGNAELRKREVSFNFLESSNQNYDYEIPSVNTDTVWKTEYTEGQGCNIWDRLPSNNDFWKAHFLFRISLSQVIGCLLKTLFRQSVISKTTDLLLKIHILRKPPFWN